MTRGKGKERVVREDGGTATAYAEPRQKYGVSEYSRETTPSHRPRNTVLSHVGYFNNNRSNMETGSYYEQSTALNSPLATSDLDAEYETDTEFFGASGSFGNNTRRRLFNPVPNTLPPAPLPAPIPTGSGRSFYDDMVPGNILNRPPRPQRAANPTPTPAPTPGPSRREQTFYDTMVPGNILNRPRRTAPQAANPVSGPAFPFPPGPVFPSAAGPAFPSAPGPAYPLAPGPAAHPFASGTAVLSGPEYPTALGTPLPPGPGATFAPAPSPAPMGPALPTPTEQDLSDFEYPHSPTAESRFTTPGRVRTWYRLMDGSAPAPRQELAIDPDLDVFMGYNGPHDEDFELFRASGLPSHNFQDFETGAAVFGAPVGPHGYGEGVVDDEALFGGGDFCDWIVGDGDYVQPQQEQEGSGGGA
ncbi:hypothetical protein GP486_001325 [Trichoglossum hirsutum]|uniref:Uncharacterized protein n=1 Tax=Trichoglossum hirsutum TaxID=265104 RepID=A0A9P8LH29_9PEZI|nr:hypothetical protein GP486_001325 [Trichoglossum hirsutum]